MTPITAQQWQRSARVLLQELRGWGEACWQPSLAILLVAFLLALCIFVRFPLFFVIDVGKQEGYGGDLPMLQQFNGAERHPDGVYRWTTRGARVHLAGVGTRLLLVRMKMLPIGAPIDTLAPAQTTLQIGDTTIATLPTDPAGRCYHLLLAPSVIPPDPVLVLHMETFTPPDDPRALGTPLDQITVISLPAPHMVWPERGPMWRWLATLVLMWALMVRTLQLGLGPTSARRWGMRIVGGSAACLALASWLDPFRWAAGASPALQAMLGSMGLLLCLRPIIPKVMHRIGIERCPSTLSWLLIIIAVSFGMRLGGKLYPFSMWGDIGFHTNRFIDVFGLGKIYLLSRHRGVNFPYPPGPYFPIAPLILFNLDIRSIFPLVSALVDGLSVPLIYLITVISLRGPGEPHTTRCGSQHRVALIAAVLYAFAPVGIMLTWWSFSTHIYSQFALLMLITVQMVLGVCAATNRVLPLRYPEAWLFLLVSGVFLGHFGFLINTALMGGCLVAILWIAAMRGVVWAKRAWKSLLAAYVGAGLVALLLFYTAYVWLFADQFRVVLAKGLPELAQRAPVPHEVLWHDLWNIGFIQHYGFFPLLLLPVGMWLLWTRSGAGKPARRILVTTIGCSVLVSGGFGLLPFLTHATQNTRWLTFSAWAVAVGSAVVFRRLWWSGKGGRVTVVAMFSYLLWNTGYFWFAPMLWRIRPPEPF